MVKGIKFNTFLKNNTTMLEAKMWANSLTLLRSGRHTDFFFMKP